MDSGGDDTLGATTANGVGQSGVASDGGVCGDSLVSSAEWDGCRRGNRASADRRDDRARASSGIWCIAGRTSADGGDDTL